MLRSPANRDRIILSALILLGACTFLSGIGWGVPSRQIDPLLFGSAAAAWSGDEIVSAAGRFAPDPSMAADADANPLGERDRPIVLNDTRAKRAEIIRRYRLYSNHPDEMLTFMALAGMPARRFDPGMYQYGGLWFYPIGGLLRIGGIMGLVRLSADPADYLDHPEAFGRFYVVARLYSAAWGLIGIGAVYFLGRRLFGGYSLPAAAGAGFALMPAVINGAHEVKPHLAGAVLVLLAVSSALKYVRTGARRWWMVSGIVCGLAMGMVLTGIVAFAVIPAMVLLRPQTWGARSRIALAAIGIGLAAYCLTNPYVPIGLARSGSPLRSNLANLGRAGALFGRANERGALVNSALLIAEGASPAVAVFGGVAAILMSIRLIRRPGSGWSDAASSRTATAVLLAAPAGLVMTQLILMSAGKPGEFGRFAIVADVALLLAALGLAAQPGLALRRNIRPVAAAVMTVLVGIFGLPYVAGFVLDENRPDGGSTRMRAARRLAELERGLETLAVYAEPAPYSLPPVNLMHWRLVLMPTEGSPGPGERPDVLVRMLDAPAEGHAIPAGYERQVYSGGLGWFARRISWADKPVEILVRRGAATGGSESP